MDDRAEHVEELVNALTHGVGLVLSFFGVFALVVLASLYGDVWHVVSCSVYGGSLVTLYLASTLYHSARRPRAREILRAVDHACIYVLIAGTYTPFALVMLRGHWGWTLFGLVWGCAIIGVFFKVFFTGRFELFSTLTYLFLGWAALLVIDPIMAHVPEGGIAWLFAGGMAYTLGVIFYAWERPRYAHAAWHVFVLAGSVCHYLAVLLYVVPGTTS